MCIFGSVLQMLHRTRRSLGLTSGACLLMKLLDAFCKVSLQLLPGVGISCPRADSCRHPLCLLKLQRQAAAQQTSVGCLAQEMVIENELSSLAGVAVPLFQMITAASNLFRMH